MPNPTEPSDINVIEVNNAEEFTARVSNVINDYKKLEPNKIVCMMGIVVATNEDGTAHITGHVLGSDDQIAKMITSMVRISQDGIIAAHSSHQNENKH